MVHSEAPSRVVNARARSEGFVSDKGASGGIHSRSIAELPDRGCRRIVEQVGDENPPAR